MYKLRLKRKSKWLLTTLLVSSLVLSACGGKKEEELKAQIESLQRINAELESKIAQGQEKSYASSLITVEGSGTQEYVTIDNLIKFPRDVGVKDTEDDVANSLLRVGTVFSFSPSNNWEVKINGAEAHFSHPQKVWGTVKAIKVSRNVYDNPGVQESLDGVNNFLQGQPINNTTFRRIYMADYHRGYLARGEMIVDKREYVVNVGSLVYGDYGVLFLFVYEDNKSGVQQELIDLLITSGHYGDTRIVLQ